MIRSGLSLLFYLQFRKAAELVGLEARFVEVDVGAVHRQGVGVRNLEREFIGGVRGLKVTRVARCDLLQMSAPSARSASLSPLSLARPSISQLSSGHENSQHFPAPRLSA